jgi:hypothetical protein
VKLVNVKADIFNSEQINLLINSGEMPDASFMYQSPLTLWEKGVIRSIPRSYIEKYSPSYKKLLDMYPIGWKLNRVPGKEDEYLAINGIYADMFNEGWFSYYRLDWLEKIGIKPKGQLIKIDEGIYFTDIPFTIEELDQIFNGFLKLSSDGKETKYPLSGNREYINYNWETLINAFGLRLWQRLEEDGQFKYYYQSKKMERIFKNIK